MLKVWALGFVTCFVVRPSCTSLSVGVTIRSDFQENVGVASVMPLDVPILVAATVGTITCWNGPTITICFLCLRVQVLPI